MPLKFDNSYGTPLNYVVTGLLGAARDGELILDPPFQRGSVWTDAQREAWIESVVSGLPLPALFINQPKSLRNAEWGSKLIVIDGRQRLEALLAFEDDRLSVRGEVFSQQSKGFRAQWRTMGLAMPTVFTHFDTMRECVALYVKLLTTGTAHTPEEIADARRMLEKR